MATLRRRRRANRQQRFKIRDRGKQSVLRHALLTSRGGQAWRRRSAQCHLLSFASYRYGPAGLKPRAGRWPYVGRASACQPAFEPAFSMLGEFLGLGTTTIAVHEAGETLPTEILPMPGTHCGEPCSPGQAKDVAEKVSVRRIRENPGVRNLRTASGDAL